MLLGFISLLLTIGQVPISKICVPRKVASIMLPCNRKYVAGISSNDRRRKLLWDSIVEDEHLVWRRSLAGASSAADSCSNYGVRILIWVFFFVSIRTK